MIVLADNDTILKLAAFDMLHAACSLLGVVPAEIRVLDTARYVFRKRYVPGLWPFSTRDKVIG